MTVETSLIFGLIACIITIASFYIGRQGAVKNDGERWGRLETTLEIMQKDLNEIKITVARNSKETKESLDKIQEETKESIKNIHERINRHLSEYHNIIV